MTKEALQIALEALTDFDYDKRMKAIESIKEALETKQWVGLTPNELNEIFNSFKTWNSFQLADVYCAIEQKLKEKNYAI